MFTTPDRSNSSSNCPSLSLSQESTSSTSSETAFTFLQSGQEVFFDDSSRVGWKLVLSSSSEEMDLQKKRRLEGHSNVYTQSKHVKVYKCRDHPQCSHQVKVCPEGLWERGVHSDTKKLRKPVRGIHHLMLQKVDDLLTAGVSPKVIKQRLNKLYRNDDTMLGLIPEPQQLYSRKRYILKSSLLLDNVASIRTYLRNKSVQYNIYIYLFQ